LRQDAYLKLRVGLRVNLTVEKLWWSVPSVAGDGGIMDIDMRLRHGYPYTPTIDYGTPESPGEE
jgi:hypothetical protein